MRKKRHLYLSHNCKMIRILALFAALSCSFALNAQDTTEVAEPTQPSFMSTELEAGPVLNSIQLNRQKWFYSMDEAMRQPDKVYKLSLTKEKLKAFPYDLSRLKNLQVLNLSGNKIKEIPGQIAELPNLQIVILTNNKIRTLPDEMSELENLEALYLGNNNLAAMPGWIGGLSKLRKLDLSYNQLSEYEIGLVRYRLPRCDVSH